MKDRGRNRCARRISRARWAVRRCIAGALAQVPPMRRVFLPGHGMGAHGLPGIPAGTRRLRAAEHEPDPRFAAERAARRRQCADRGGSLREPLLLLQPRREVGGRGAKPAGERAALRRRLRLRLRDRTAAAVDAMQGTDVPGASPAGRCAADGEQFRSRPAAPRRSSAVALVAAPRAARPAALPPAPSTDPLARTAVAAVSPSGTPRRVPSSRSEVLGDVPCRSIDAP